jgi:hypothetical protein
MRHFSLFLALFFSTFSYGQFAIISDKDGSVNVREDGHSNSKIIDSLQNGHLIYCFENTDNWTNIDYSKKNKELNGYVYYDRYKLVSSFLTIPVVTRNETSVKLKKDSIEITLSLSRFEKSKHKFKYFKETPDQIELIDDKKYWGKDGGMPTTQFDKIILKIEQKLIILPKQATEGLYEPSLYSVEVYFDKQNNAFYIQTMNSDGAGYYEVIWKIKNSIYEDRLVAYGF